MERDERALDDGDSPYASFRGATLRIEDKSNVATLSLSPTAQPPVVEADDAGQRSNSNADWLAAVSSGADVVSPIAPSSSLSTPRNELVSLPWSEDDVRNLFSYRDGLAEKAIEESIKSYVQPDTDGDVIGSWILTEISIWDAEKERVVILTSSSLLVIKYDFIALKPLEMRRTALHQVDTVVSGDLVYAPGSLVPRMNGLATGMSSVVKGCLLKWSRWSRNPTQLCHTLDSGHFEPRSRNMRGLRIMWNQGEPVAFTKKWNPFTTDIPFLTFASHPLLWHKGNTHSEASDGNGQKTCGTSVVRYDVESLSQHLVLSVERVNRPSPCTVQHKSILLQNYIAIGSLIHNRNSLGFFKVRGRFSF